MRINELSELEVGIEDDFQDWDSLRRTDGGTFGYDVEQQNGVEFGFGLVESEVYLVGTYVGSLQLRGVVKWRWKCRAFDSGQ